MIYRSGEAVNLCMQQSKVIGKQADSELQLFDVCWDSANQVGEC